MHPFGCSGEIDEAVLPIPQGMGSTKGDELGRLVLSSLSSRFNRAHEHAEPALAHQHKYSPDAIGRKGTWHHLGNPVRRTPAGAVGRHNARRADLL